jgi:hypothetical protein
MVRAVIPYILCLLILGCRRGWLGENPILPRINDSWKDIENPKRKTNMKTNIRTNKLFVGIVLSFCALGTTSVFGQSGDQKILDGIGETGLIARYVFDGDVKDWSRNNLHARIEESKGKFINDDLFGKVLSLPVNSNAIVTIPGEAITGVESLSISGWVYLRSRQREGVAHGCTSGGESLYCQISQQQRSQAQKVSRNDKDYGMTPLAPPNLRADPDAAMTTPGDTTTASLAEVEKVMKGAGARVDR